MAYDDEKKHQDKGQSGHDSGKERIEKSDRPGNLQDKRDYHKGEFNKNESWITRPTTSETPTQPPTTQDGGKEE